MKLRAYFKSLKTKCKQRILINKEIKRFTNFSGQVFCRQFALSKVLMQIYQINNF